MARSQNSFIKNEREKKKLQKKKEKQERKEERKANSTSGDLEGMMAYVDEYGNIVDTPPDPNKKKKEIKAESIEIGVPKTVHVPEEPKKGRVAFFNTSKGFGFIDEEGSRERFFVHQTGLKQDITEGDKVTFEVERGPKGLVAVNVTLI